MPLKAVGPRLISTLLLAAILGCTNEKPLQPREQSLGSFYVNKAGETAGGAFTVGAGSHRPVLGFLAHGLPQSPPAMHDAFGSLASALASGRLRVRVQLFTQNPPSEFYSAEFCLGQSGHAANYTFSGFAGRQAPLFFFVGIEPMPYETETNFTGKATVWHGPSQTGHLPSERNLSAGSTYRAKLTVLEPLSVTNKFELIVYSGS